MSNANSKIFIILLVFFLTGCVSDNSGQISGVEDVNIIPGEQLEVVFFDVGQGDAILINTPDNKQILIDGGPDNAVLEKLKHYLNFGDNFIDAVVLTHPHADHVNGLVSVLKRYQVGEVWLTGVIHTSSKYLEFLNLVKGQNIAVKVIYNCQFDETKERGKLKVETGKLGNWEIGADSGCTDSVRLGPDLNISFLWPDHNLTGKTAENLNNSSIAFKLDYKNNFFLFTGDAEVEAEEGIIKIVETQYLASQSSETQNAIAETQNFSSLRSQILKIGHHGAANATRQEWLDLVQPDYAIISVGQGNSYGHPSLRVIRRLERAGVAILRTDQAGDIVIKSDGENLFL